MCYCGGCSECLSDQGVDLIEEAERAAVEEAIEASERAWDDAAEFDSLCRTLGTCAPLTPREASDNAFNATLERFGVRR